MNWIGIGIGGIALMMLLLQLADMQLKMIRQQEIMEQAKRIRWICRPEGCVEIPMDWDAIMEKTDLEKKAAPTAKP